MADLAKIETNRALAGVDLEAFVAKGDMRSLSPEAKAQHYVWVCNRLGLEAATKPFDFIVLNGKEIMYANKGCAEQLRMLHKVSIQITHREEAEGVFYVYARASLPDGRFDEDCGAVSIGGLKGDALANAKMKATTKAKRRVTLSVLGLGMLDESELETIQPDRFANLRPEQPKVVAIESRQEKTTERWTSDKPIPESILKSLPPPCRALAGIAIQDMDDADLDMLIEQGLAAHGSWSKMPGVSQRALALLQEIVDRADAVYNERNGEAKS